MGRAGEDCLWLTEMASGRSDRAPSLDSSDLHLALFCDAPHVEKAVRKEADNLMSNGDVGSAIYLQQVCPHFHVEISNETYCPA